MSRLHPIILLACAGILLYIQGSNTLAADDTLIRATVTVDAGKTLRTMDPQRLGGTNIAMWYYGSTYDADPVQKWMPELHARYIRMPGGSWANGIFWNGNGVRDANGKVDPNKIGPDGYPAVDYSGYAPSFRVSDKDLHPEKGDWHGHVDVKKQHEFIKAIPETEAMVCPNAGTGRAIDAAEWVKWANKKMGYNVRYWEIGNELGGSWEAGTELPFGKGKLTAEMYTKRYNDMANAMRQMDPTIKIGGGAFAEEMIRDCGENVDFVMIHTYPGSITQSEAQMFADIDKMVEQQTSTMKQFIHKYQPQREKQIELAYTEWNLSGGVNNSQLFSGLWSSIFLAEIAKNGVDIATQWDCFSDLFFGPDDGYARKSEYYALWLWNNYMGDRLIPATSNNKTVFTYASRSEDAVCVMLINTDRDCEAQVNVRVLGFKPAAYGESATVTNREYYLNSITRRPQWSIGPRIEQLKTGSAFSITLSPFSMTYVRLPKRTKPGLSPMAQKALHVQHPAQGNPGLRFVMPTEVYAGDQVLGELIVLAAGSELPYSGTLAPATLTSNGQVIFDRDKVRLSEAVGHFNFKATAPGEVIITAQSGDIKATHTIMVKPSEPRPVIFWDFTNPPVTDNGTFSSDFALSEDLTQRANRAVARIDMSVSPKVVTDRSHVEILKIASLPGDDKLNKSNIRGVIADLMVSPDFACDDPNARITAVMQSPANWWMKLSSVPLKDIKEWKTYKFDVTNQEHFKAMPSAFNLIFILEANKPVKMNGSLYFDRIGFMVR